MRNIPTTRASRLSAVRLMAKARVIRSRAAARAPAGITCAAGGRSAVTRASSSSPRRPSDRMRSTRLRRPTSPSSSCAVAMSVTSVDSRARALSASRGTSSPTRVRVRRAPPTRTAKVSPLGEAEAPGRVARDQRRARPDQERRHVGEARLRRRAEEDGTAPRRTDRRPSDETPSPGSPARRGGAPPPAPSDAVPPPGAARDRRIRERPRDRPPRGASRVRPRSLRRGRTSAARSRWRGRWRGPRPPPARCRGWTARSATDAAEASVARRARAPQRRPLSGHATLPSLRVSTRSATRATSALWVTAMTVFRPSRLRRARSPRTRSAESVSRLPVGSSARISSGSWARARATATRCCSPPESRSGKAPARSARPTSASSSATRRARLGPARPISSRGRRRFSSTVRVATRLKNWKTKPMWRRRKSVRSRSPSAVITVPPMATSPALGASIPLIRLSRVDLPEPLRPAGPRTRPGRRRGRRHGGRPARARPRDRPWRAARSSTRGGVSPGEINGFRIHHGDGSLPMALGRVDPQVRRPAPAWGRRARCRPCRARAAGCRRSSCSWRTFGSPR